MSRNDSNLQNNEIIQNTHSLSSSFLFPYLFFFFPLYVAFSFFSFAIARLLTIVSHTFSPVPEITWRRANGVPFPSKVKMKNSNVVLEIPSFQQEDAGGYECVAENKMGKNTVQGRLSFHGMIISLIVFLLYI